MFLPEWRAFPSAPCLAEKKKLDNSSLLNVVEIARVPDLLPSLFPFWSGYGIISTAVLFLCGLRNVKVPYPAEKFVSVSLRM